MSSGLFLSAQRCAIYLTYKKSYAPLSVEVMRHVIQIILRRMMCTCGLAKEFMNIPRQSDILESICNNGKIRLA